MHHVAESCHVEIYVYFSLVQNVFQRNLHHFERNNFKKIVNLFTEFILQLQRESSKDVKGILAESF